jgi:hypothetical protein
MKNGTPHGDAKSSIGKARTGCKRKNRLLKQFQTGDNAD